MSEDYPALTVWQPWASLIAVGAKPTEFRSWPAPRRLWGKRIAIHAGARPTRSAELQELLVKLASNNWRATGLDRFLATDLIEKVWNAPKLLPLSSIVCIATLGEPIRDAVLAQRLGLPSVNDSDRDEHSNWGWPLTDIEVLRPFVPARGAQGLWTWRRECVDA